MTVIEKPPRRLKWNPNLWVFEICRFLIWMKWSEWITEKIHPSPRHQLDYQPFVSHNIIVRDKRLSCYQHHSGAPLMSCVVNAWLSFVVALLKWSSNGSVWQMPRAWWAQWKQILGGDRTRTIIGELGTLSDEISSTLVLSTGWHSYQQGGWAVEAGSHRRTRLRGGRGGSFKRVWSKTKTDVCGL